MRTLVFILSLSCFGALSAEGDITHPDLREELLQMESEDQRYRLPGNSDLARANAVNQSHVARLKSIVSEYGWPTISMVGLDGEQAAWLIVQHADSDRPFQQQVLGQITPLVAAGEISAETYAYLYDRLHTPQRYGTQGECKAVGEWIPYAIEEPLNVDSRRNALGMVPLAIYIGQVSAYICTEKNLQGLK